MLAGSVDGVGFHSCFRVRVHTLFLSRDWRTDRQTPPTHDPASVRDNRAMPLQQQHTWHYNTLCPLLPTSLLVKGCCQLDQYGELLFTALTLWLPWQRLLYISYGMGFMSCLCSCIPIWASVWLMWKTGRGTFECYPPISRHTVRMRLYDTTASAPS